MYVHSYRHVAWRLAWRLRLLRASSLESSRLQMLQRSRVRLGLGFDRAVDGSGRGTARRGGS